MLMNLKCMTFNFASWLRNKRQTSQVFTDSAICPMKLTDYWTFCPVNFIWLGHKFSFDKIDQ